jgi:hypothetical protein
MRIEVLADVKTTLGEGPLWDVEEQRLYWIDMPECRRRAGGAARRNTTPSHAVAAAAADLANTIGASAVVAFTSSGNTVMRIACKRPQVPILATPDEHVSRRLCLSWGAHSVRSEDAELMRTWCLGHASRRGGWLRATGWPHRGCRGRAVWTVRLHKQSACDGGGERIDAFERRITAYFRQRSVWPRNRMQGRGCAVRAHLRRHEQLK